MYRRRRDGRRALARQIDDGLFDFAEVRIFLVNWADLTQGVMKLRRGYLGDVMGTPSGTFETTLNGLMQMPVSYTHLTLPTIYSV